MSSILVEDRNLVHDDAMHLIVVSDLHFGSPYFLQDAFFHFLATLPESSTLVLNGDVAHEPWEELPATHKKVVDSLRQESFRRPVVWVLGNHDSNYVLPDPGNITFARHFAVGCRLLIVHGHEFDRLSPHLRWLKRLLKFCYQQRLRFGAPPASMVWYAKRWAFFYQIFTRQVRINAVRWAKAQGFAAIVCGHTHYPEDVSVNGVRYINTGSWTETPPFYLSIIQSTMQLTEVHTRTVQEQ